MIWTAHGEKPCATQKCVGVPVLAARVTWFVRANNCIALQRYLFASFNIRLTVRLLCRART